MTQGQASGRAAGKIVPPEKAPAIGADQRSVKSAERVFDLLEQVLAAPQGSSFAELGAALNIPKSSLHALLGVIERRGYLQTDPVSRKISLGLRALDLGQAYLTAQDLIGIATQAMGALVAEVNETAQLAQLSGRENVYLARVDSSHSLRLQSQPGMRLPAHATGVGKAILAQRPADEIAALFDGVALATFGTKTIATFEALRGELDLTRQRGFAIDNEEYTPGVFCLAVPVFEPGKPVSTAISVSIPTTRASSSALAAILPRLARCSLLISRRLGTGKADPKLGELALEEKAAARIAELIASKRGSLAFT